MIIEVWEGGTVVETIEPTQPDVIEIPLGITGSPGPPATVVHDPVAGYPARPAIAAVIWIGPVDPDTLAHDGDIWVNTA